MFTTKPQSSTARLRAFTLVEFMVASSLALLASTAIIMMWTFTTRSFCAMTNYTDLALTSRKALDIMSRDIRQATLVTAFTTNSLSLKDVNGNAFSYVYDPATRTLVTNKGGQTTTNLTGCDSLQFWIYQRTPKSNTFECYDPAFVTNTKLVQVTWSCSRTILGARINTETIESAKITIRNN